MLQYLRLRNVGPASEMEIEFAPRINVLTGDNGLGKSFLLDVAWWALTRTWSGNPALPRSPKRASISYAVRGKTGAAKPEVSEYRAAKEEWPAPAKRPAIPGIVVYARIDGGFSVWDPARNYWRSDTDRPAAYHFDNRQLWEGLKHGDVEVCEGLERDWVSWQKGGDPQFKSLVEVLRGLAPPAEKLSPGPPRKLRLAEGRERPTIDTPAGNVHVAIASAGIRRILGLAYLLVWAWHSHIEAAKFLGKKPEKRIILLIDEPETHLHPAWQRQIIPSLMRVVEVLAASHDTKTQVVFTTHAPLVLASLEAVFSPDLDAWSDLDLVEKGASHVVQLERRPFIRQGDASAWLMSRAFDLRSPGSVEAERILDEAATALSNPKFDRGQAGLLQEKLRKVLSDTDPFWVRWRFVGERKGWLPS
ncbi:MAG: ATP-binding protein [Polyangiaceae bacterium]